MQRSKLSILFFRCSTLMLLMFSGNMLFAQHTNIISASLDGESKEIDIQQEFTYVNTSEETLSEIYFNDWPNAYSSKNTELAQRFAEEFKKSLHLAKDEERGYTNIISVVDEDYRGLQWKRFKSDIILIKLHQPIVKGASVKFHITYTVKLPPTKYTPFGYNNKGEYYLKDWYLTPAVHDGKWHLYNNKNLEDLYTDVTNTTINFSYPENLFLNTNYETLGNNKVSVKQHATLSGINRKSGEIILKKQRTFTTHITPHMTISTDFKSNRYNEISQGISINKVLKYITENLGEYPHKQLLVSEIDYAKSPLYGINQLPSFVRPYEEEFQYEMTFLKTALLSFIRETIYTDPRKEKWMTDAIVNYLMISYVDTYYPNQMLLGKLSSLWGVRSFNLAKMSFNDQYPFLSMLTARKNLGQAVNTPNDSLIKFNQQIANGYKAGQGLAYLSAYIEKDLDVAIKNFYTQNKLKPTSSKDFIDLLKELTPKNIDWFNDEYIATTKNIDYKIKKVIKSDDSLQIILKNKSGTQVPMSIFGLKKDSVISKYWFSNASKLDTLSIPRNGADKLVLNYDKKIPEYNQRDNWKSLNGFFSRNKKLRFQFFKDTENPYYNQVFYVPVASFNIYDGLTPGMRIYNKTMLERPFIYDFSPSYAMNEKSLVGSGKFSIRKYHNSGRFYVSNYSLRGSSYHFQTNSRYSTFTPSASFGWRSTNLRSNKKSFLNFRYVNIFRQIDENLNVDTDPDYSVLNARYINSNTGIIDYSAWFLDAQHSTDFSKVVFDFEYRKLFKNNRQLNLRLFAGKFLRNKTNSDFFSFALDRPTDYLFDYGYLGRSEDTGIYSQQIIIAEGGFKSKLDNPFANNFMATANVSTNLWKWIEAYGDAGFMKNKGQSERFVYDAGIRLNLVTDYFELYFPFYSNLGWEVSEHEYSRKIRFIVTISPKTLTGLFTRKWF